MNISTMVISDIDRFEEMKEFWDKKVEPQITDPFFSSSMLIAHWRFGQEMEENPFLIIFSIKEEIIGFSAFLSKSNFGFRQVHNFDQYRGPVILTDTYREECFEIMINYLLKRLNCQSIEFIVEDGSRNQTILERISEKTGLNYSLTPSEGQAIIPVETNLDSFRESMDKKARKELHRKSRRLEQLGSWKISCSNLDENSIQKIWNIEKFSWKAELEGKASAFKDLGLKCILNGVKRNEQETPFFNTEIWFLDLNELPIAYMLTIKHRKTIVFAKTSYDARFKRNSPGVLLTNELIEKVFRDKTAEKIDFITNLPFIRIWKPTVKKKSTFRIQKNPFASKARTLIFENRISQQYKILERIKWKNSAISSTL